MMFPGFCRMCQGVTRRWAAFRQPARLCSYGVARDQVKIPKVRALATACVLLWAPSLRANSNLPAWQEPQLLRSCHRLSATMHIEFAGKLKPARAARAQAPEIALSPECDYAH
jgi:hypothetical protein